MELPLGFTYSATYAGIRAKKSDDVALIVSGAPASAAAVFTTNQVQAAPVKLARRHLKTAKHKAGALLINAGNANCATRTGDQVALKCCKAAAKLLRYPVDHVLPASTGVIGVELDERKMLTALPKLQKELKPDQFERVAHAILTTDTVVKTEAVEVSLRRGAVRIAGMTKGSGMIHPRMATTLGFVMTDANIPPAILTKMLARANERTYGSISVDGDMSTNDMVVVLANGASGVRPDPKEFDAFEDALTGLLGGLARKIARDGEGARKLITIEVSGAMNEGAARQIGRAIANSPLVKTAIGGSDPNWGRILCAAGYSGVRFDPAKVTIEMQGDVVCRNGLAAPMDESGMKRKLDAAECFIRFEITGTGRGKATFWTCDLTEKYIEINGSYRT